MGFLWGARATPIQRRIACLSAAATLSAKCDGAGETGAAIFRSRSSDALLRSRLACGGRPLPGAKLGKRFAIDRPRLSFDTPTYDCTSEGTVRGRVVGMQCTEAKGGRLKQGLYVNAVEVGSRRRAKRRGFRSGNSRKNSICRTTPSSHKWRTAVREFRQNFTRLGRPLLRSRSQISSIRCSCTMIR
jgi:hypothetical protein